MDKALQIVEHANNCTIFNDCILEDADLCIKSRFFNAVLGRTKQGYTQNDVSELLGISKRLVSDFEKGKVDKLSLIFKYINAYGFDFANNKKDLVQISFMNKNKLK